MSHGSGTPVWPKRSSTRWRQRARNLGQSTTVITFAAVGRANKPSAEDAVMRRRSWRACGGGGSSGAARRRRAVGRARRGPRRGRPSEPGRHVRPLSGRRSRARRCAGSRRRVTYWGSGQRGVKHVAAGANDFSVAATPATATVTGGHNTTFAVSSGVTSGVSQPIALSVTGLPDGASASFAPSTISAGDTATMTVSASISTAPGTTQPSVVGTGTSATHITPVSLTVNAPAVIRAAFYYPWFPEAWTQQGLSPFTNYVPTRGYYSTDVSTVAAQIADLQYAGVTLGIASWFGQTSNTEKHWPAIIAAAQGTGFAWAPYYEKEGTSDPTPQQIADDLHYLRTTYGGAGSALASLPGKGMPVFVYNADDPTNAKGCDTVDRWNQARQLLQQEYAETIYIDLKVFPQYASCAGSPTIDGWHQYGPASAQQNFSTANGDGSYSISPGGWKAGTT